MWLKVMVSGFLESRPHIAFSTFVVSASQEKGRTREMAETQSERTNVRAKRKILGLPLIGIIFVAVLAGSALAAYVFWWQSGVVGHQITVYGLAGLCMPSTPTDYYGKAVATVLVDCDQFGGGGLIEDTVLIAIESGLLNGDIHLKCDITSTYPGAVTANAWFVAVGFAEGSAMDTIAVVDYATPMSLPTDGVDYLTLTQAEATDIFYLNGQSLPPGFDPAQYINALLIQFEFSDQAEFGVYDFDITLTIEGEES